jgi:phosphoglucosamine mutase
MKKLFGTDGVRGVANIHPLTSEMALQIGRATAYIFKNTDRRHRIVIGKDTRISCYMLEQALASGICSMGVDVLLVGPLPTPAIAFITTGMRADAGMVISASHNPYQDNGIKIFSRDGYKLPDDDELRIEDLIFSVEIDAYRPTAEHIGKAFRVDDAQGRYIEYCKNSFPRPLTLEGLRIVLDCAHGAAYKVAPVIFSELGAEVISFGVDPDGENINKKCGALYPDLISRQVIRHKADIGIALDGDADRVSIVDENGQYIDGDQIMAILGVEMLKDKTLKKKTLVTTVMSNMALDILIKKHGGKTVRTKVGDRYVVEEMRANDYNFGGEQSGHLIFRDYSTTGDGIISALKILAVMRKTQKKLSELAMILERLPQVLVNVKVREKIAFQEVAPVWKVISEAEKKLKGNGRVLVRYSGTELLARVMVEGPHKKETRQLANRIAAAIKKELG